MCCSVSARVIVDKNGKKPRYATVTKAHPTLVDYDILYLDGTMEEAVPAHELKDQRVSARVLRCYDNDAPCWSLVLGLLFWGCCEG